MTSNRDLHADVRHYLAAATSRVGRGQPATRGCGHLGTAGVKENEERLRATGFEDLVIATRVQYAPGTCSAIIKATRSSASVSTAIDASSARGRPSGQGSCC